MYPTPRPLVSAGLLLGAGLGGFLDGILFHQILQLHNMLSGVLPKTTLVNAEVNMFWDGIFHAFTWAVTALGLFRLWSAGHDRAVPWSGEVLLGAMIMGWGAFNLVEGIVDHYLLGVHHVVERLGLSVFDAAFAASGAALLAIGAYVVSHRTSRGFPERVAPVPPPWADAAGHVR
jgi:uncharacterized membrane protein